MSNAPLNNGRRRFLTATTAVVGGLGAAAVAVPFIKSWNPSAKAKAAGAPVEVEVSKLEPGQMVRVEWLLLVTFRARLRADIFQPKLRSILGTLYH